VAGWPGGFETIATRLSHLDADATRVVQHVVGAASGNHDRSAAAAGGGAGERVVSALEALSSGQQAAVAEVLAGALKALAVDGEPPDSGLDLEAWQAAVAGLARLRPSGLILRTRPEFFSNELLADLRDEALAQRAVATDDGARSRAEPGPVARRVAVSRALCRLIGDALGAPIFPTLSAAYIYHLLPGEGSAPHVDLSRYAVHALLMVDHRLPPSGQPSALVVYRSDGVRERIDLAPGELIVLHALGTTHGREPMGQDEQVTLLALGFSDRSGGGAEFGPT
jgi:hypothetical protein